MTRHPATAVRFPRTTSGRSTLTTGAAIVSDSLRVVAPDLADQAVTSRNWRKDYVGALAGSTWAAVNAHDAITIADHGLAAAWTHMAIDDGVAETSLQSWYANTENVSDPVLGHEVIRGDAPPVRELVVPYRGQHLAGAALEHQLREWMTRGIVEPGFAAAVQTVIDNPQWLNMTGHRVVLLGAAAAMGPLEQLSSWGGDIVAVDVPVPAVQDRIHSLAAKGAGAVTVPLDESTHAGGLDFANDLVEARQWMAAHWSGDTPTVLSTNAYSDGGAHVCVNLAADVLAADLIAARSDATLAYLNTPHRQLPRAR